MVNDLTLRKATTDQPYKDINCGSGLQLRVNRAGQKTFRRVQRFNDKQQIIQLGTYPKLSLAKARDLSVIVKMLAKQGYSADVVRKHIAGDDSALSATKPASIPETKEDIKLRDFAKIWHQRMCDDGHWKELTAQRIWNRLELHVFPHIGDRRIADIQIEEIIALLRHDRKWTEHHVSMSKVKQHLDSLFCLAKSSQYKLRTDNPADFDVRFEGMQFHHRELPQGFADFRKIPELVAEIDTDNFYHCALYLLILTCLRAQNIVSAEWAEIDFEAAEWAIPREKMKGTRAKRREHNLPLQSVSLALLKALHKRTGDQRWVFPLNTIAGHIDASSPARTCLKILGDREIAFRDARSPKRITAHGFRHSFRTWAGETGFRDDLAEAQLAHVKRGIQAVYDHSERVELRREMMEAWERFVTRDRPSPIS